MVKCTPDNSVGTSWYGSANTLPAAWDEGLPDGHFLRTDALKAHEAAGLRDYDASYAAVIAPNGSIMLRASFAVLHVRASAVKDEAWSSPLRTLWRTFARIARPRLLVGGHPYRHDVAPVVFESSISPYEAFGIYERLLREAARRHKAAAILVKDVDERLIPYFHNYGRAYLPLRNDISMELAIQPDWFGIDDYGKSLKHKYAQRFRKVRSAMGGISIAELDADTTESEKDTLYKLYHEVAVNQAVRLGYLSPDFLPALKRHYGDKLRIWLFKEGEKPVAFASGWMHEKVFDMFYIGLDYSRNASLQLYFNILFFSVEQAILARKSRLILGRTALEAKARVGCTPEYLHTFLYIRNPVLRAWVQRQTARRFREEGAWEERHPFKAT